MRYVQRMAFTTLLFFSLFTVFNAHSDDLSAFVVMFLNKWLWGAVVLSLVFAGGRELRAVPPSGVFDGEPERRRLAALRGGRQFGAVAPRADQAGRAVLRRPRRS
jgi:hypothetical protein